MKENWAVIAEFLERWPGVGIFASMAGLGAGALSWLHAASIVFGFGGTLFGCLAGYYTWRIKRRHWERILAEVSPVVTVKTDPPARKVQTQTLPPKSDL